MRPDTNVALKLLGNCQLLLISYLRTLLLRLFVLVPCPLLTSPNDEMIQRRLLELRQEYWEIAEWLGKPEDTR